MSPKANMDQDTAPVRYPRSIFAHAHQDGDTDFPVYLIDLLQADAFLELPDNWNGTDKIVIKMLGANAFAEQLDIILNAGTHGEAFNIHTQTVNNIAAAQVLNQYLYIDLTASFAAFIALLNPLDIVWMKVTADQEQGIYWMGFEVQET